jgi:hypothetical protein
LEEIALNFLKIHLRLFIPTDGVATSNTQNGLLEQFQKPVLCVLTFAFVKVFSRVRRSLRTFGAHLPFSKHDFDNGL